MTANALTRATELISDELACEIARERSDVPWPPLAATGEIPREQWERVRSISRQGMDDRLAALAEYIVACGPRGPVDGWSTLDV